MKKNGKNVGGGIPGINKMMMPHSGGHGTGKFGEPHKFYDQSVARYKGPNKSLEMVKGPDGKPVPFFAMDDKGLNDLAPKMMKDKQAGVSKYNCGK